MSPEKGGKKENPQAVLWFFIPHGAAGASLEHLEMKSRERNRKAPSDPRVTGQAGDWMGSNLRNEQAQAKAQQAAEDESQTPKSHAVAAPLRPRGYSFTFPSLARFSLEQDLH